MDFVEQESATSVMQALYSLSLRNFLHGKRAYLNSIHGLILLLFPPLIIYFNTFYLGRALTV